MTEKPTTVEGYLESLEPERRAMIDSIRHEILQSLDDGFEETIEFGMLAYVVPLEKFPDTYNKRPLMYAALASQKRYVSLYLMCVYSDNATENWFHAEYAKTGKRLDMGKSCVRFRKASDIPLDLIGRAIAQETPDSYIEKYQNARSR